MKLDIIKMTEADIDAIYEIEKKLFSDPWSKQAFLSDLKNDFAYPLTVRFENKVAGYACLYRAVDEVQIGNFAVAPDFHQRGIGTMLMERILGMAAELEVRLFVLEVRPSNEAARKLYMKFGFKEAGKRRYYYRKPTEDALILIKGVD
ncbi:MAG TPA: ribosomal-protein-alanine N-acetyltransferase [candidate division Zixibacteria bacterium]|nr:ribosomal-protein-alanine N-acetyltransferase [candidate division Zixibacteria bacterium]